MEIHQFHPSFAYGDAIGNEMIELQKTLKAWGYKSNIYSQYKDTKTSTSENYKKYLKNSSSNNILIIHFSIAFDEEILKFIESLPDKKILIYHNITPSQYFAKLNSHYESSSRKGRWQLKSLSKIIDYAVGDSEYNRRELDELGFKKTGVLPILLDFAKYGIESDKNFRKNDRSTNILFVGRISPNKKHDDLIKIFYYYKKNIDPCSKLYLVGSYEGMEKYYNKLTKLIKFLKLDDVYFTGKIDFNELISYYKSADVFLCMSEHEGFCVPLIESMIFDIPVMAFNSSAIPYTLGNSGVLINNKNYEEISELMHLIVEDKELREKILIKQRIRLKDFNRESIERIFRMILNDLIYKTLNSKKTIQVEGTFEDSYSLSIVNRNLALALDAIPSCDVSLYPAGGTDDYRPNLNSIKNPKVLELYNKKFYQPDFSVRNIYPPQIFDMKGKNNWIYFAWEESRIPRKWVGDFNTLDGIFVPSSFVKKVLIDSGVKIHIFVVPNGLNHELLKAKTEKPLEVNTKKKYKFLNISSAFPRKGIDILLNAFYEEFTKDDDVCLIIKSFPNIHNRTSKLITDIKTAYNNCPDIVQIDRDLDDSGIAWLYKNSNCLVYPTRGEGFGFPIAEAMLFKIPVITTNYSGHLDFCNDGNSFLINYKLEPSQTHLKKEWKIENSFWAEPDKEHLKRLMRFLYENISNEIVKNKTENAYETVSKITWKKTANEMFEILKNCEKKNKVKVGIVSTWNIRCGIAEYTKYLVENVDKNIDIKILANYENIKNIEKNKISMVRCWNRFQDNLDDLYAIIKNYELNIVHFQFNFGLFKLKPLVDLIKKLKNDNINIIITFHSVKDIDHIRSSLGDYKDDLKYVDIIWVHTINDIRFLSTMGIEKNVVHIPQGIKNFRHYNNDIIKYKIFNNKFIISSFGFFLPHKGILEIIESLPILMKTYPDILFIAVNAIYPDDTSREYFKNCTDRVRELNLSKNVIFFKEYLPEDEIIELLRLSDIVIMAYKETKESSSAAIRFAVSSYKPIIASNAQIFDEFRNEVYTIENCSPESIANGIIDLKNNKELQEKLITNSMKKTEEYSWANIAKIYEKVIHEIVRTT